MSLKTRRDKTELEAKVKTHLATNPVFHTDFGEWIAVQRSVLVEKLVQENDNITRGMIQMLDKMKKDFGIKE